MLNSQSGDMRKPLKLHAISMIRNEADIIVPFCNQLDQLFDKYYLVDISSSDGTSELLKDFQKNHEKLKVLSCKTQEKYQSAMMNCLAREAFQDGADWVFFLDADEFLNVRDRASFEDYVSKFSHDVMHLPWINLIPTEYGSFDYFKIDQTYHWSGRVSPYRKIALSSLYSHINADFHVVEGNHHVLPQLGSREAAENLGLGLLHVPIRSFERLKYKQSNSLRLLGTKHNSADGEGSHVSDMMRMINDERLPATMLNALAADYGVQAEGEFAGIDPEALMWPSRAMPDYLVNATTSGSGDFAESLGNTLVRDAEIVWDKATFVKNSLVGARIAGSEIKISAQPMIGKGTPFNGRYKALPGENPDTPAALDISTLMTTVSSSLLKIEIMRFSAWSKLIPILYALFPLLRPRRYVELGVHNGMSFFAACQVAEHLQMETQCVAVDSWIGDPHAAFHSTEVFDTFRETLAKRHPEHHYIQGFFLDALKNFDDQSVDLLHIDGYHTYEAVREDFETWLPKMSETGTVIFHDINVHERNFGVWRYWEELKKRYPSYSFYHCHGLGVLYVGKQKNAFTEALDRLSASNDLTVFAQQYFEILGEISTEHLAANHAAQEAAQAVAQKDAKIAEFGHYIAYRDQLVRERDQLLNEAAHKDLATTRAMIELWKSAYLHKSTPEQRARDCEIIASSALFDANYYIETYPDVREANYPPIEHFVRHGVAEFRNPRADFDVERYLTLHRDVTFACVNPFVHYITAGRQENRQT